MGLRAYRGLHELLEHRCAQHQVAVYEVWDNVHELHKRAGDYDAVAASGKRCVRAIGRSPTLPA